MNQASKAVLKELMAKARGIDQAEYSKIVGCWFCQAYTASNLAGYIVPVKKKIGQICWLRDLNKAHPKYEFTLRNIDMMIDVTA